MRDVLTELSGEWNRGAATALATVVRTFHSAPRPPGAAMLRRTDETVVGSVSGGCVEGAVYELAGEVLGDGRARLERYGVSDDAAFAAGLTCGGQLDVFVEEISPEAFPGFDEVARDIATEVPVAVATVISHPGPDHVGRRLVVHHDRTRGSVGSEHADHALADDVRGFLASGTTGTLTYGPDGERRGEGMEVFVASFAPRPRMLIFGAIDFAAAMARQGSLLGYRVTVCDARSLFATRARFPDVDEIVVDWPHRYLRDQIDSGRVDERAVTCVLTHDPKFDVPLLEVALDLPVACYIGAMGSRRTHDDRITRLRERGVSEDDLARIRGPIGLDLGGRTPEETAVSIAAEIIADRWGGTGEPLRRVTGRIHHEVPGVTEVSEPTLGH